MQIVIHLFWNFFVDFGCFLFLASSLKKVLNNFHAFQFHKAAFNFVLMKQAIVIVYIKSSSTTTTMPPLAAATMMPPVHAAAMYSQDFRAQAQDFRAQMAARYQQRNVNIRRSSGNGLLCNHCGSPDHFAKFCTRTLR